MDSRTEERVNDWDSRPLSDGFDDLRELADREFSGAVAAAGATLFMLNGRVVGIVDGDMSTFEDASGTIHVAPHPSLPLLFAMRERGGEERAKYYTNDTPVSEADDTLSSGTFTGYVELSENVLSGDYFVVYYGGRSMSCAFVGNSERLVTGDEAFERADDEVGIYTVYDVEIEVTDIPEPDDDGDAGAVGAAGAAGAAGGAGARAETGANDGSDVDGATNGGERGRGSERTVADRASPSEGGAPVDATRTEGTGADGTGGRQRTDRDRTADSTTAASDDATTSDAAAAPPADERRTDRGADGSESVAERPSRSTEQTDRAAERSDRADERGDRADERGDRADERGDRADERSPERGADRGQTASRSADAGGDGRGGTGGRRARETGGEVRDPTERHDTAGEAATTPSADPGGEMAEVTDEVMAEVEDEAASEFDEESAWQETTTIPSINPERTTDDDPDPLAASGTAVGATEAPSDADGRAGGNGDPPAGERGESVSRSNAATGAAERARNGGTRNAESTAAGTTGAAGGDPDRLQALESELEALAEERDAVAAERDDLARERDDLARERDDLRERNRELQVRVEELESEVSDLEAELAAAKERLESDESDGADGSVELSRREALAGTNLFVRYGSKSGTTMEDVHDSDVSVADLESNLRLEYHTGFDAADAVVDDQPYDEFLYASTPYRFVEWFVYDFVFEVRDTGNESDLVDLYEAFPEIDRIELYGDVSLRYEEGGEEHREQTTFDVVVRDRMGNPLAVANVNDGRAPATEEKMVDLQERAARVKRTSDALAGAFMVTASYFEPGALEAANEATSGSLLRRDSRKSYVKLSRKRGYHLCLVESRNGEFHVSVPEL